MLNGLSNLFQGRLPAYTRNARHVELLARYGQAGKIANLARAELALARGDTVVKARPYVFTLDTGNVCNLRCPLCPTGVNELKRPQSLMTFAMFDTLLQKISPYAIEVILHNWGEPFLNPDILQMVRAANEAHIGTTISSNLNLVNRGPEFLEEVVDSGLDHLTVSLDGTTQRVYEQYRKGGNIDEVFDNLRHILRYRRERRSRTPVIEWQFLVMKHNEHQMEDARRRADELGVDRLRFAPVGLPFDDLASVEKAIPWLADDEAYRNYDPETIRRRGYLYDERCFYLYRGMTVNPGGEVSPCCAIHHQEGDFGGLAHSTLDEVWNNQHYQSARALFSKKESQVTVDTICARCPLFKFESGSSEQEQIA